MITTSTVIKTFFCNISITSTDSTLIQIRFTSEKPSTGFQNHPLLLETIRQLNAYCDNPNFQFDLPLAPAKTIFQKRVRELMQKIPVGSAWTYLELSKQLQSSPRAIGNACRCNDFPLIVPCHRIIASNGLGGFNGKIQGEMIDLKIKLLKHEKFHLNSKADLAYPDLA